MRLTDPSSMLHTRDLVAPVECCSVPLGTTGGGD